MVMKLISLDIFFSGDLDHVYEISLTEEGSMNQPEFIFKFKDIQLVKR